jgi:hypothetical protein
VHLRRVEVVRFTTRADQIFVRFSEYVRTNPHVFDRFCYYADVAYERLSERTDEPHFGAQMIVERIRWYYAVEIVTDEPVRINNDFAAYFARAYENRYPDRRGFFHKRKRRSTERPAYLVDLPTVDTPDAGDESELEDALAELLDEIGRNDAKK